MRSEAGSHPVLDGRVPFLVLILLLALAFLIGGTPQPDLASLVFLRPLAAVALGVGCWNVMGGRYSEHRFLCWMAAAILVLTAAHLVPLPPSVWQSLPGRGLVSEIEQASGLNSVWRPLSLVPSGSWNALFALIPPFAALLLAMGLSTEQHRKLVPAILIIGFCSACVAVLQLLGDPRGPLYFYSTTKEGAVVGLFANRNHQAVFLSSLFPLLAIFASPRAGFGVDARARGLLALAMVAFLIPLILVSGSRAGLVTMVMGWVSVAFLYRVGGPRRSASHAGKRLLRLAMIGGILLLVLLTAYLGRAVALDRLIDPTAGDTIRFRAWGPMLAIGMKYFPFGSGFGSFVEVFQVDEPRDLLATSYFPHAHNDWLELLMTGGLPALILLGIAVVAFVVAAVRWWRLRNRGGDRVLMGGAGLWMVLIYAVGSAVDYPLRVPSLSCLFCVIVIWISSLASIGTDGEGV